MVSLFLKANAGEIMRFNPKRVLQCVPEAPRCAELAGAEAMGKSAFWIKSFDAAGKESVGFRPIKCVSEPAEGPTSMLGFPCELYKLPDHSFYLVDSYCVANCVDADSVVKYYAANGAPLAEVKASPSGVKNIRLLESGDLRVEGSFRSQEIDGISDFDRQFCIDEDCVEYGGAESEAIVVFDRKGKIKEMTLLRKAEIFHYPKEKKSKELKRMIDFYRKSLSEKKSNVERARTQRSLSEVETELSKIQ